LKLFGWKTGIVVFVLFAAAAALVLITSPPDKNHRPETVQEDGWISANDRINILLLGTDEELGSQSRTDTIILVSLDHANKKVSLLSIPRDTRVDIPGHGENKINAANLMGGADLVRETLSSLLKVPIDYYVITNFNGFKQIVDTLGGVEIDVERDMQYRVYDGMIDIKKGLQRLDGDKALQYVRFRHDKLGDITRTQRQQKFLTALAKEVMEPKNLIKLPVLIPELTHAVETDINIAQMIGLAKEIKLFDLSNITVQTLPGNFVTIDGVSYWCVDAEKAHQVVLKVFTGESDEAVIDESISNGKTNKGKDPGEAALSGSQEEISPVNKNDIPDKADNPESKQKSEEGSMISPSVTEDNYHDGGEKESGAENISGSVSDQVY